MSIVALFSGHVIEELGRRRPPGAGVRQCECWDGLDDLFHCVGKVGFRIDDIEFAALDQRCDNAQCSAPRRPGEECNLPVQCKRPDGALNDVEVDLDRPVVEEIGESAAPAGEGITDCLGELGLVADQGKLGAKPGCQAINDPPVPFLADGAALVGAAAADVLLRGVEFGDLLRASVAIAARPRQRVLKTDGEHSDQQKASCTLLRSATTQGRAQRRQG